MLRGTSTLVAAVLLLLSAPVAAYRVAPLAGWRTASSRATALSVIRMQDEPAEDAAPAEPAARTSPLAGIVGEQSLSEFQAKKEEDNAKRTALRERINIALPAIALGCLAIAQLAGPDKTKDFFGGGGDPFGNAPGVAEAREAKKERVAKVRRAQRYIFGLNPVLVL